MARRFRWDFVVRLTIERTRDDLDTGSDESLTGPWWRWVIAGLVALGIVGVVVYRALTT